MHDVESIEATLPLPSPDQHDMNTPMSIGYRAYILAIMVIVYALSYIDRTLTGVLAPLIKADLNLTDTQLGVINGSAFAIVYACATLPFGWLADRYNRARIISGAVAFWSASTIFFGVGGSFAHLLIARAGVGLGEAAGGSTSHSLLVDYFTYSQRARALAIYGFGPPIGVAAGAIVGGWISGMFGWRAAFLAAGSVGMILAVVFTLTVREPARVVLAGESFAPEPFFRGIRILLGKPGYVFTVAGITLAIVAGQAKTYWIPSYMVRSFHVSVADVAIWYGVIWFVGGISGAAIGGYISDRWARTNPRAPALVTGYCYLATAPLLAGCLLATNSLLSWLLFSLATLVVSFGNGPVVAAIQYFAGPSLRGTASAIMTFCLMLFTMAIGLPLIGMLSDALAFSYGQESLRYALLTLPIFYIAGGLCSIIAGRWMTTTPGAS